MVSTFRSVGFENAEGRIGRDPVSPGCIIHPGNIWIEGKSLYWKFDDAAEVRELTPRAAMLDQFIKLWDQDDAHILEFAKCWGPLRIDAKGESTVRKSTKWGRPYGEPLAAWRFFSERAYSVLALCAALLRGRRGDEANWHLLSKPFGEDEATGFWGMPNWSRHGFSVDSSRGFAPDRSKPMTITSLRTQVAGELSRWMERYRVGLAVTWKERGPQIEMRYEAQLLSAIAFQLTLTSMRERKLYTCSGCGTLYNRNDKRPNAGWANFCRKCRRSGRPGDQADSRRLQRRARAREMYTSGSSVEEITTELKPRRGTKTVLRWLKGLL